MSSSALKSYPEYRKESLEFSKYSKEAVENSRKNILEETESRASEKFSSKEEARKAARELIKRHLSILYAKLDEKAGEDAYLLVVSCNTIHKTECEFFYRRGLFDVIVQSFFQKGSELQSDGSMDKNNT